MPRTKSRGAQPAADKPATNGGQDLVELGAPVTRGHAQLPELHPDSPFFYAYHPARFTVMGDRCIPLLAKVVLAPGVEQCDAIKGRPIYTQTVGVWRKKGYTIIEPEWSPNGRSYIHRVAVRGGYAYLSIWTKANPGTQRLTVNEAGYCDWLDELLKSGKLPDPQRWKLEEMLEDLKDRILSKAQLAERDSATRARVNQLQRQADAIAARLEEIDPDGPSQQRKPILGETVDL